MDSETPIVGSEKTQPTTLPEVGQTISDPQTKEPATATETPPTPPPEGTQLPVTTKPEPPIVTASFDGSTPEGALKALRWCGLSKSKATKILRAAGGSEFLKLEILRSVATSFELPTLEIGEKMLKTCAKLARDKNTNGFEKAAMMRAFASIVEQLRHLKEEAILTAEKYAPNKPKPPEQSKQSIQLGVSINNFPPLAPTPNRARRGVSDMADAEEERDRAL